MIYYILLLGSFFLFCYWYFGARKLDFPGPTHYPFFGAFFEFLVNRQRFYDWVYECAIKYGEKGVLYFSMPIRPPFILLLKPEHAKHVLRDNMDNYDREPVYDILDELLGEGIFNVDGERWKTQRKTSSHMFSTKKLNNKAFNTFIECSDKLIKIIDKYAETGEAFDIKDLMFRTTMDTICQIAFDYNVGCLDGDEMPEFAKAIDWSTNYLFYRILNPIWKLKRLLNFGDEVEYKARIKLLNDICYKIIENRRLQLQDPDYKGEDILSMFMDNGYDDPKFLRDIVFSFIIAGRDTTASTLSWLFYELSKNPNVEDEIRLELAEKVSDKQLTAPICNGLDYTKKAFFETLRLHPPVPIDMKFSKEMDDLGDGVIIPKNVTIVYSQYVFGRLESLWGENWRDFNPDRWDKKVSEYKFISFNAGPRICLGKYFAILEARVILAKLLEKFKFELVEDQVVEYSVGITSSIKGKLMVKATRVLKRV